MKSIETSESGKKEQTNTQSKAALAYSKYEQLSFDPQSEENWSKVFEQQLCTIEKGNARAQYELGKELATSDESVDMTVYELQTAALQGVGQAFIELDELDSRGHQNVSTRSTEVKEFHLYLQLSEIGNDDAQYRLAECYENGVGTAKNVHRAAELYQKLAQNNHKAGTTRLVDMHVQSIFGNPHSEEAVAVYRLSADIGCENAQYELAGCLFDGQGTQRNRDCAAKWYRAAAAQNNAKAASKLAKCYACGFCEPESDQEAFQVFKRVTNQNDPDVLCAIGTAYRFGWGVDEDIAKAVKYYVKAADTGSYEAMERLLECKGNNVDNELAAAFEHFQQRADTSDVTALFNLGSCQHDGIGCETNYDLAAGIFEKAASSGCSNAVVLLGWMYINGYGVDKNEAKAFELLKQTVNTGNRQTQYALGECCEFAIGIDKDEKQAALWYEKATAQGHADAANRLGYCYSNGYGVEEDMAKAFQYYKQAAIAGDDNGQYNTGVCYKNGKKVKRNYERAVYWYQKAVDQGHAHSMTNLGLCYEGGRGVPEDINKAFELYKKAAETGKAVSEYNLAICYYGGTRIKQNYKLALEWFEKAAENGEKSAFAYIGDIYYYGRGVEIDLAKAGENYEQADELTEKETYNLMACYDSNGIAALGIQRGFRAN